MFNIHALVNYNNCRQVSILTLKHVQFVKNIQLFPAVFCVTITTFRTKISVAECSWGPLKHLQVCIIYSIPSPEQNRSAFFKRVVVIVFKKNTQNLPGKLGRQSAIFWNSLGLCRDYGLIYISFRNRTSLFSRQKAETLSICLKKTFVKPRKIGKKCVDFGKQERSIKFPHHCFVHGCFLVSKLSRPEAFVYLYQIQFVND